MSSRNGLRWILLAQAGAGIALACGVGGAWWLRAHGVSLGEAMDEMKHSGEPRFEWRSVDKKHWQVISTTAAEDLAVTDAREGNNAGCAPGMVRVKGGYRNGDVESLQDAACTDWISKDFPARCRTFDKDKLTALLGDVPKRAMDYCVDRFEYPNQLGQNPMIVVTFHEAESMCKKASKRLCTETEWTFACEGDDAAPYPYGYTRDATACVVDRNWRPFAEGALQPRDGKGAQEELDRLWQAEPSGSRGTCKSPFGVYDMTGNVDEWTHTVKTTGYQSVLKGGYWGPVRARCRPATRAHNEDFVAYQQGFRCCADSNASIPAPVVAPPVAKTPELPPIKSPAASIGPAVDYPTASGSWDEGDEIEALRKARVGMRCNASLPTPTSPYALALATLGLAAFVTRRRR